MDLDHISTIQFFNTHIWQQSRQQITNKRLQLFHLRNGAIFYSIHTLPTDIQQLFRRKPTGDNDTFKLLLFFIGNGCSPVVISKWILTSQHWATHAKGEKRARQIDFVVQDLNSMGHLWFYFDLHHSLWLYLNGERDTSNS